MKRCVIAVVFACAASLSALAQDKESPAFPDREPPAAAVGQPRKVDRASLKKLLKKNLGATTGVDVDPKTGMVELTYDFRKGQEKDWEISDGVVPATAFAGIRIGAGDSIAHKVAFRVATCMCRYSCNASDAGLVVEATQFARVTTRTRNIGRCFELNGTETNLGRIGNQPVTLKLVVTDKQVQLIMNGGKEVAVARETLEPFHFIFHGGNNGAEVGGLTITGELDAAWVAGLK